MANPNTQQQPISIRVQDVTMSGPSMNAIRRACSEVYQSDHTQGSDQPAGTDTPPTRERRKLTEEHKAKLRKALKARAAKLAAEKGRGKAAGAGSQQS
jgi:hypothetical protein